MIERAVKECPHSLFIIDEMDKMPPGVIDSLKPYLDFYEQLGGVDYRKATFFFLRYSKSGLPADLKSQGNLIFFQGQGIVREF